MKKVLKRTGLCLLVPLVLIVLLAVSLYLPPVQRWAVARLTAYASEKTGMEVSIGQARLEFPLRLRLDQVSVVRPQSAAADSLSSHNFSNLPSSTSSTAYPDTLADIDHLGAHIAFWPLLKGRIDVDELRIHQGKIDTDGLIDGVHISGQIGQATLSAHGIDLKNSVVDVDHCMLENSAVSITTLPTPDKEDDEEPSPWQIAIADLSLKNTDFAFRSPADTLALAARMTDLKATGVDINLTESRYAVGRVDWNGGDLDMQMTAIPAVGGLREGELSMHDVGIGIDSLVFQSPDMRLNIDYCHFREQGGLEVSDLSGQVSMTADAFEMKNLKLKTPTSSVALDSFSWPLGDEQGGAGSLNMNVHGQLSKRDLEQFIGPDLGLTLPNQPLMVDGRVSGTPDDMRLDNVSLTMPSAFTALVSGTVSHLGDAKRQQIALDIKAQTQDMSFVKSALPADVRKLVNIPYGIGFNGKVNMSGSSLATTFTATQGRGRIGGTVKADTDRMAYTAKLTANAFPLQHFLPTMGLSPFTGKIDIDGQGTDITKTSTRLKAHVDIDQFIYQGYSLDHVTADATIANGITTAQIDSENALLKGKVNISGVSDDKYYRGTVVLDVNDADLTALGVSSEPFNVGLCGHLDVVTDMDSYYNVRGQLGDIAVKEDGVVYRPDDMQVDLTIDPLRTQAMIDGGDFDVKLNVEGGLSALTEQFTALADAFNQTIAERRIDQAALRQLLPTAEVSFHSGRNNFITHELKRLGYAFKQTSGSFTTSAEKGIFGQLAIDSLTMEGFQLDTIRLDILTKDEKITYAGRVVNNKNNPDYTFRAYFDGELRERGTDIRTVLYDAKDKLGVDMALSAIAEEGGVRVSFSDLNPVLGYNTFHANRGNYLYMGNDRRVSADMKLSADEGMGILIYSNDDNEDVLQDVTLSLHRFDLAQLLSALPYTPDITGTMNGDFHIIQEEDELSISTTLSVDKMHYEKSPLGDLSTEFVYIPKGDGSHFIDGLFFRDDRQVAALTGTYTSSDSLQASLNLDHIPLDLLNGFIPNRLFGFRGYAEGDLKVDGTVKHPIIDGEVFVDSSYIYSEPYGVEMRFADDPVKIAGSRVVFENFEMFANNDSPLNIAGEFDFSNLDRMTMDIMMRADDFQLIDAKENLRSEAYGKAFVNFFGTMKGPVESLQMRGKLDVLGTTDMTYVLRDSELSTDTQLDELVKFTNLQDTLAQHVARPPLTGFDMSLNVNIDEAAHIVCALNAEQTNYIDLVGSGDLRMRYTVADGIALNGRYTLNSGEMKYALPVIPLKTFNIGNGSYIEFNGEAMNPTLSITATENVKATVNEGEGNGRPVDFSCGVKLSQTLSNPGIEFIIEAPGDVTIQDELNTMTVEERGKVAITMLASGMYLTDGNTSSFSMNSALSTFLQSEINNIAGSAMRSMGLNLGMSVDNSTNSSGEMHTDYNFSFSKRLWNNRLNVMVGGKVSTGNEVESRNNTFFDNVELEYRLNQRASQYLRMFYDNSSYDWLDGVIGVYGVGFKWTRKLQHFKDIFRFKTDDLRLPQMQQVKTDSLSNGHDK